DDRFLDETLSHVRLDLLQLHGKESPERLNAIRLEYGLPVMKAVSIATVEDLVAVEPYLDVVDWLLFDAKAPPGAKVPGGRGVTFDWSLLKGRRWPVPWMLAGGLNAGNLTEAVRTTGAGVIDVSSGVEDSPGVKNPRKILDLLEAADRL
ncbi:MAG: phosphoribosylanthranilate isomerase, partial [Rhodospirillales bacterium]|nr:phosphoribosylanthranilate isomerase [Rhodospirillales bacterium]